MAVELADNATRKISNFFGLIQREGRENDLVLAESEGNMDQWRV